MPTSHINAEIVNNEDASQFEIQVDGQLAIAQYVRTDQWITFTHTETPAELQGQGVASRLIRGALQYARAQGLRVVPRCPFVAEYIQRHPEFQDLVW